MFFDGIDLLSDIRYGKYDLVLLGYALSGMSGPEAARETGVMAQSAKIVFISSSAEADAGNYGVGDCVYACGLKSAGNGRVWLIS